jgi:hypothetical protein
MIVVVVVVILMVVVVVVVRGDGKVRGGAPADERDDYPRVNRRRGPRDPRRPSQPTAGHRGDESRLRACGVVVRRFAVRMSGWGQPLLRVADAVAAVHRLAARVD